MTALVFTCLLGLATPALVQQGTPPPPAAPTARPSEGPQTPPPGGRGARGTPAAVPTPEPPGRMPITHYDSPNLQNVRVEVALTDSLPTDGPSKRIVTMMVVDNNAGQIRSQGPGNYSLNVDASPHVRPDGKIFLMLTLYYVPEPAASQGGGGVRQPATLNESVSVMVADGKATMISQSADPRGDRKVTVEVTATVVK